MIFIIDNNIISLSSNSAETGSGAEDIDIEYNESVKQVKKIAKFRLEDIIHE